MNGENESEDTKMTTATKTQPVCFLQVNSGHWCQESYDTQSRDANRRANDLRKLGYKVTVFAMGSQVTKLGLLKLSMVDIRPGSNGDTFGLPAVEMLAI